ncbi:DUF5990 family protein [Variovorax sp. J22P271]|uniref:DUF5990 family protein n=1 Tax=Variovorax davisae TaxID=3053515 RepID=UPI0025776A78|nr:DUF5990 family protein [Variovorax sp. J22P271]MDM0036928.1 DUF5990 family protein [Variovorax sp. J22P271]
MKPVAVFQHTEVGAPGAVLPTLEALGREGEAECASAGSGCGRRSCTMRAERYDLPLRIVVEEPVRGLTLALQQGSAGKATLLPPARASSSAVTFELEVTVDGSLPDGRPRLLGALVQGPPDARFVYLAVGKRAGQVESPWDGRVKVPLGGLGRDHIEQLPPGGRLVARIAGQSSKGAPALASVRLLPPGWSAQ